MRDFNEKAQITSTRRGLEMLAEYKTGKSLNDLARSQKLSVQRVQQIIKTAKLNGRIAELESQLQQPQI